jgi:AAA+ ATPase superfamily predicted ATPase
VDKLRLFGVFGRLARHLAEVDPAASLAENIQATLLAPHGPLEEAPLDMLRSEHVSSVAEASAVLAAVADGEDRFNNIAARTGLTAARLDRVLRELVALNVIEREVRFGDAPGARFARYACADPFTAFWYRHVLGNRSALFARSPAQVYTERVAPRLDDHMGPVFEQIARQAVARGLLTARFGPVDEVASWWSRDGQTQIDLVAGSPEGPVFVECKWRAASGLTLSDLQRLRGHVARAFPKIQAPRLALVSAGAADRRLATVAEAEGIGLYGMDDLLP